MKTKSTTDTLVTERCCKSTIPFILDDPKSIEGIGEILIDLCNGRQVGNMKVGLRKPKSIPVVCANFSMGSTQRYYRLSLCTMVVTLSRNYVRVSFMNAPIPLRGPQFTYLTLYMYRKLSLINGKSRLNWIEVCHLPPINIYSSTQEKAMSLPWCSILVHHHTYPI